MSTAQIKYQLHTLIDTINDSKTLNAIYSLSKRSSPNSVDILDEKVSSIKRDLSQIEKGQTIKHSFRG